jgi:NAD-dependent DNA ligase
MFGEGTAIDEDGLLTEKAIELLKIRFGENVTDMKSGMDMDEIPAMVTVQSIAQGVTDILNSLPETCPKCDNSAWKSDDGVKTTCGSCGENASFSNGDDLIKEWLTRVQKEKNIF